MLLGRIRAWTGLDPIAGHGVEITVNGEIDAGAVDDLLNELHNAGAEAIAIDDIRVVARTSVSGVPGSLDVDGVNRFTARNLVLRGGSYAALRLWRGSGHRVEGTTISGARSVGDGYACVAGWLW